MFNKIEWNKKHITIIIYCFIVIAFAILFYKFVANWENTKNAFNNFFRLIAPFLFSFLFAFLLNPGVVWFENFYTKKLFKKSKKTKKKTKRPRYWAILTMYVIVLGFIILTLFYVVPQLVDSISRLFTEFPETLNNLINSFSETADKYVKNSKFNFDGFAVAVENNIPNIFNLLKASLPQVIQASKSFTNTFLNTILGIVISVYLISDKERFIGQAKKFIYAVFSKNTADKIIIISSESNDIFKRFFIGKLLDSLIIGFLCFILMKIFRFPYELLISVIVAITNMIPYFGPFIGAVPGFFIILIISPIKALWFIVFIFGLQQFDGIFLGPKILGGSVGLRPFWIIFSIIIGGGLFGFIGMLLGVPVFTVIYNLFKKFINNRLEEKNIKK